MYECKEQNFWRNKKRRSEKESFNSEKPQIFYTVLTITDCLKCTLPLFGLFVVRHVKKVKNRRENENMTVFGQKKSRKAKQKLRIKKTGTSLRSDINNTRTFRELWLLFLNKMMESDHEFEQSNESD